MLNMTSTANGVRLEVKVQPRSSKNQICGEVNGCLKIKLTAPPVDGEANQNLINFLSAYLQVARSQITILRGDTSRHKLVEINGVNIDWLRDKFSLVDKPVGNS